MVLYHSNENPNLENYRGYVTLDVGGSQMIFRDYVEIYYNKFINTGNEKVSTNLKPTKIKLSGYKQFL